MDADLLAASWIAVEWAGTTLPRVPAAADYGAEAEAERIANEQAVIAAAEADRIEKERLAKEADEARDKAERDRLNEIEENKRIEDEAETAAESADSVAAEENTAE